MKPSDWDDAKPSESTITYLSVGESPKDSALIYRCGPSGAWWVRK